MSGGGERVVSVIDSEHEERVVRHEMAGSLKTRLHPARRRGLWNTSIVHCPDHHCWHPHHPKKHSSLLSVELLRQ